MPKLELPKELTKSFWDRKKGAVPPGSAVETKLKSLQKSHDAVDWKALDDSWAEDAASPDALKEAHAAVERLYRSKVLPLKAEAEELSSAAAKAAKDKAATKETASLAKEVADAVKGYVKDIDAGMAGLQKVFDKAMSAVKDAKGDDDDEPVSALLEPKRLLAQLRRAKADPAARFSFAFVAGDSEVPPALAMHPRMSPKALLAKLQVASGQKKGTFGTGRIEDSVMFLQVEKAVSGLVKKARLPIKAAGFKISKIVLEDESGAVLEEDDDANEGGEGSAPTGVDAGSNTSTPAAESNAAPSANDEQRFAARLKALIPVLTGALTSLAKRPETNDATRLQTHETQLNNAQSAKLKASEAGVFARKKDWAQAQALLDQVEQLLEGIQLGGSGTPQPPSRPEGQTAEGSTVQPSVAPSVAFTQTRLVWDQTRKKIQSELRKLEASILDTCKNEPDLNEIAEGTKNLYVILEFLDERLIDKLDEAYNATDAEQRKTFNREAREIINEYTDFVASEPLMQDIDDNGFTPVAIRSTLVASLTAIDKKLKALT